jgi:putative methyltransferase
MSLLYTQAAQTLAPCLSPASSNHPRASSSLKSRALKCDQNQAATLALASETLRYKTVLDTVLAKCRLTIPNLVNNQALGYVLVYELLLGLGEIRGGGGAKRAVMHHATELQQALVRLKQEKKANSNEDLLPAHLAFAPPQPRYARVNFIKTKDVNLVMTQLGGKSAGVTRDDVLPSYLIRVSSQVKDLARHDLVLSGAIILQDKSSCFPAHALASRLRESRFYPCSVLDATAAPGNKTTQLAALLPKCKIMAMDRDPARFAVLQARVSNAGCGENVELFLGDFLDTQFLDPKFAPLRAILLDPSCSGSGTTARHVDRLVEEPLARPERLDRLSEFQGLALRHALSFPQVQLVSYSTCSVHERENEQVVSLALAAMGNEWELIAALPEWTRRRGRAVHGLTSEQASKLARADVDDDTGGFFVALFQRRNEEGNPKTKKKKKKKKKRQAGEEVDDEPKRVHLDEGEC